MCLVAPFEVSREGLVVLLCGAGPYRPLFVWGLLMQLGVASSLDLWRQPHWPWNGSISRACEAIKFSCRAHFTGSTGIVHELEVRGLVAHPSGPSTADSTYMQQ